MPRVSQLNMHPILIPLTPICIYGKKMYQIREVTRMKMRYLLFLAMPVFVLSGVAAAGITVPAPVSVPAFTPWGAILGAAVLGISGVYTLLRKK